MCRVRDTEEMALELTTADGTLERSIGGVQETESATGGLTEWQSEGT